ncbi:MAG: ABC transporter ATP-binding protein [Spirochaetaceae bacterium]|nr:ABC transporter ATP-binding protein [Spirochaetaceae bacterium]MCF7947683.1 ABC transporter ATP-binding protein [Spirochaetia bacterium]MCF7950510.1 ABC transporter ATP-binding protein [Spirochaetaceae bacterium]
MSHGYAIEVEHLEKRFGHFTAVDKISFNVPSGSIFGLLGANGAGKSTTIRMLCGLLPPSGGSARVAGVEVNTNPEGVKRSIGYMSQEFSLYNDLTVDENIRFFGGVYGLSNGTLRERREWILSMSGLGERHNSLTSELSGGMKQRLALGCAVIHSPQLVFLDEPTGGVDPVSRREFWRLINQFAAEGTTVLVTTHYLDEAEYCNSIVFMHAGEIVASGSPAYIKKEYRKGEFSEVICDRPLEAVALLKQDSQVVDVSLFGTRVHLHGNVSADLIRAKLERAGIRVDSVQAIQPGLEDVFIGLIEQTRESRPGGGALQGAQSE